MIAVAVALSACASRPEVSYDATAGADLASYGTYAWVATPDPPGFTPATLERVRQVIDDALASKGFTRTENGQLGLTLTVSARETKEVAPWGPGAGPAAVYHYTEGRLVVSVLDAKTGRPLWRGEVKQALAPGSSDASALTASVDLVVAGLPSRAGALQPQLATAPDRESDTPATTARPGPR